MITQSENESPADEVAGGMKNAIERGQNLTLVRQSFLNAGYKREIVDSATRKISGTSSMPSTAVSTTTPLKHEEIKIKPATYSSQKSHKLLVIILIITAVLILVGAGLLGLFWEQITSLFS